MRFLGAVALVVPPVMEQAAKPKNRRRDVLVAHPPAPSRQLDEYAQRLSISRRFSLHRPQIPRAVFD